MQDPDIYLIDNGSLRPSATFGLRRLAAFLSEDTGRTIEPVSLLHSHKIAADELDGEPATILKRKLRASIAGGKREFILLPLFLGPSRAISEYIPEVLASVKPDGEDLQVWVADPVCGSKVDQPDKRLAEILRDQVCSVCAERESASIGVAMVDHGTPAPEVNRLRNAVAADLGVLLKDSSIAVTAASMERRDGAEFAFNEPLLENLNSRMAGMTEDLVVAMFFLLPGRHAGEGGDVVEICQDLLSRQAFSRVRTTDLIGEHPLLREILMDRLEDVLSEKSNLSS
jgi:hypothetical protein